MRRFAALAAAGVLAAIALSGPAAASSPVGVATPSMEHRAGPDRLSLTRAKKGVEPGFATQRITAHPGRRAHGRVRFVLRGQGVRQSHRVRIRDGRAVLDVPALGTGSYRVTARFRGRHGSTSFRVYSSAVRLDASSFTVSKSSYDSQYAAQLDGDVTFEDGRPREGYLDVYLDGNTAGGRESPCFVGFTGIATDGTFAYTLFGQDVATRYPPGTYTFQAFFTPTPSFAYYVASTYLTVTVTD